jgi:hypothetical protein
MPIANCLIRGDLAIPDDPSALVTAWAADSGTSPEHMTVNVVPSVRQAGVPYAVMATLYLPTMWHEADVKRLEGGLASALGRVLGLDAGEIHVITLSVASGHVVEGGEIQSW